MCIARCHCQVCLLATSVAIGATIGPAVAQNVPKDFSVAPVASGFTEPVAAEFAADGRLFIVERRGVVRIIQDGKLLAEPFIDLRDEVNWQWDRGMLGIVLDPDFQWIRALEIDDANQIVELHDFGTGMGNVVDLSVHPITGDVHYVSIFDGEVRRLVFEGGVPGDLDGDGAVGSTDLVILLGMWGDCDNCASCSADLDGDCTVGTPDLLILLGNWG